MFGLKVQKLSRNGKFNGNIWMVKIDNKFFYDFNPYAEVVEGDWLINTTEWIII